LGKIPQRSREKKKGQSRGDGGKGGGDYSPEKKLFAGGRIWKVDQITIMNTRQKRTWGEGKLRWGLQKKKKSRRKKKETGQSRSGKGGDTKVLLPKCRRNYGEGLVGPRCGKKKKSGLAILAKT